MLFMGRNLINKNIMSKNKHPQSYEKKLISSCDDELFMSGDIIISWRQKDEDKTEMLIPRFIITSQRFSVKDIVEYIRDQRFEIYLEKNPN